MSWQAPGQIPARKPQGPPLTLSCSAPLVWVLAEQGCCLGKVLDRDLSNSVPQFPIHEMAQGPGGAEEVNEGIPAYLRGILFSDSARKLFAHKTLDVAHLTPLSLSEEGIT